MDRIGDAGLDADFQACGGMAPETAVLAQPGPAGVDGVVESVGEEVEVLAEVNGRPVMCRQGSIIATSFHPELADDDRIHAEFLEMVSSS